MTEETSAGEDKTCAVPACQKPRVAGSNFCTIHGAPAKSSDAKSKGAGLGCLGFIALAVVFGVAMCSSGNDDKDSGPDEYDIQATCQSIIEDQLKNPSTADYSDTQQSRFSASGTVVAENALGGKVTYSYRCTVEGTTVKLVDLAAR